MKTIRVSIASGAAAAIVLIGGVASAQSVAFSSEIGVGAQGTEVTSLQTWLENNGYYSGPVTGYYGALTQAGVKNYQSANGISATGYVGPLTLASLNAKASGSSSTTVSANSSEIASLQAQLNALLAEIQAIESGTTNTVTTTSVPVGASVSLETNMGTGVTGSLGVTTGTSPYTYSITRYPSNGTITSFNSQTGAFTYTPNSNYSGSDTFQYTVSNSAGISSPQTVTVNVASNSTTSSSAATAQALSFSTSNGASFNGVLSGNGSTPLTYSIVSSPSYGTISNFNSSTGSFTYTPTNSSYTGNDSFTYTVSNSYGASSPQTVTVNLQAASSIGAPTGQNFTISTSANTSVNGTLTASGTGPFTYAIAVPPMHGTINSFTPLTGAFTYTPSNGYTGTDMFTYTVTNSSGTSAAYTVNINV